jgi:pimeloyl-ACP methyl ester carboxylesterase
MVRQCGFQTRALRHVGMRVAALARNDRVAVAAATVTAVVIRAERIGRRLTGVDRIVNRLHDAELARAPEAVLRPRRPGRRRPEANWHEGGDGAAVVLINGMSGSGLLWPEVWVAELEKRFRVIRIDNRGTGWSRWARAPFSVADMADDVRDVLDACGINRAKIVGISMGGMIAREVGLRHPGYVEHLYLLAAIPPTPAHVPAADYTEILRTMISLPSGRDWRDGAVGRRLLWFAGSSFAPPRGLTREISDQVLRRVTPPLQTFYQARAIGSWTGPHRLAVLQVATTVVQGADDPIVVAANGRALAGLIRGARHVELPGVGHLLPWEAGDTLIDLLEG